MDNFKTIERIVKNKADEEWKMLQNIKDNLEYIKKSDDEEKIKFYEEQYSLASARWFAYNDILHCIDLIK